MPLIDIPIEFEWEGISFQGRFTSAKGNENCWQLNLNSYSYGQLVKYYNGWKWCPNIKNYFMEPYMEEFFIRTVEDFLKDGGG